MNKMKQIYLFLSLIFVIQFVGAAKDYHGNRRYWTLVNSAGETNIALDLLNEPVKLIFPKDGKTFPEISSGIRLRSLPSKKCYEERINNFEFKLDVNPLNYIRGVMKVLGIRKSVFAYLYDICENGDDLGYYKRETIDDESFFATLEGNRCRDLLFKPYGKDDTKNQIDLKVSGSFKCQTNMILPKYMSVEGAPPLPEDVRLPLNDSFAGHEEGFWWKSGNDPTLPNGISFVGANAQIDILQSTKSKPYFLRIGKDQPIPTFQFNFDETCTDFTFDLYLNLREKDGTDDCKIIGRLTEDKFELETKTDVVSLNNSKSPMLVFAPEMDKVYLKDASLLSINALGICSTKNTADVPEDQLVLQFVPSADTSESTCSLAQVTLLAEDVVSKNIEVLIDRVVDMNNATNLNGTNNNSTTVASPVPTTSSTATASIEWWWFVAAGGGIVFLIVAAILIYVFCIRPRRKKQENEKQLRRRPVTLDEDIFSAQTAIPLPESPKQKKKDKKMKEKSKEIKLKEKTKEKKAQAVDESRKSEKDGCSKPSEKQSPYEDLPLPPSSNPPKTPRKTFEDQFSAVQTTQEDPTIQTGSTQNPSLQTQPGTIEKAAAGTKPSRPKLKHRTMYGPAGFVNMNDPYDYHQNEAEAFEPTINFAAIKAGTSPPLLQFENFWNCIDKISIPKRYSPVYVNSKVPGSSIFFVVRDCVADEAIYAPFRSFSNRILEPMKHELNREKSEHSTVDGEKKFFVLRVFILSYEPLTMEIHCRGQCPQFLFNLFDCDECPEIGNRLQKNAWMNSRSTCRDNWDVFLCRVKRTPINTHQFFSYNGATKPKNSDEVNHFMVIRGDKKPNKLRECIRGCSYPDASHPNNVSLETELQGDPTLQTQNTQQSSN